MRERNGRGIARRIGLVASLGAAAVILSSCDMESSGMRFGWPVGITPEAHDMRNFWTWTVIASLVIGAFTCGLIFWSMALHRKPKGATELPRQTQYNIPLEIIYTIIPVAIVVGLFYFSLPSMAGATALDKNPKVVVDVTVYKWNWKFGYAQVDGEFTGAMRAEEGIYSPRLVTDTGRPDGVVQLGGDGLARIENDPAVPPTFTPGQTYHGAAGDAQTTVLRSATDPTSLTELGLPDRQGESHQSLTGPVHGRSRTDVSNLRMNRIEMVGTSTEVPMLVLPAGTPIQFRLNSADVIHSFWVPEFLFKRDAFPHPERNNSEPRFQISEVQDRFLTSANGDARWGSFVGRCAEMCGTYHSMMNFEVRVLDKDSFAKYLGLRSEGKTNAQAMKALGMPEFTETTKPFDTVARDTRGGANTREG